MQDSQTVGQIFFALRNSYSFCDDLIKKISGKKPTLYYMEVGVAEHCNLNCKGCTSFSNIIEGKVFFDLAQFKSDITRLSELFGNIRNITLLGGEPLLNEELPQFIIESRKVFPKALIRVVTNGLLCKSMSEELINALRDNNALLHITQYQPLFNTIDSLKLQLKSKDINFLVGTPVKQFCKIYRAEGDSDVKRTFKRCLQKRCNYLSSGYLSTCKFVDLVRWFDGHFGTSIYESVKDDKINIYDTETDGFRIKKRLSKPISSCRYCAEQEWFDWEQLKTEAKIEDYCVSGAKK